MEIRPFQYDEIKKVQDAIHTIWSPHHILSRDQKLFEFMFEQLPHKNSVFHTEEYAMLGAFDGEEIIGFLGTMPFTFNNKGKKGLAITFANWIVKESMRHTGAGLKLISEAKALNPDAIVVLGIGKQAKPIYDMMRWNVLEDTPRWVGINDKELVSDVFLEGDQSPIRYYSNIQEIVCSTVAQRIESLNSELWDEFYWNVFAKNTIGIARDAAFLNWRYFNHPTFDYIALAVKDGEQYEGLAIVRIEEVANGYKIGRIVEMMYSTQDSAVALANAIVHLDESVLFYDFYSFSTVSTWGLEAVGFKRVYKTEEDPFVLPTRFQPVDLEITSMISAIYLTERSKEKFHVALDQQWYITKGDADQDRPN